MASEHSSSPGGGIPGSAFDFKAMFEAMEFARRTWSSSFSMPEALTPTVDPAELDKRIADLRTVEQWLVLNLNLLKGTIQTMELQRAALGSLQSLGEAAQEATQASSAPSSSAQSSNTHSADRPATPGLDPAAWWQALTTQFQNVAEAAIAGATTPMASAGPASRAGSAQGNADKARSGPGGGKPPRARAKPEGARSGTKSRRGDGRS
jgi:hypothetical protein